jgi:hypothetical protein
MPTIRQTLLANLTRLYPFYSGCGTFANKPFNEEPRRKRTGCQTPNIFLTTLTPQGAGNVPLAIQALDAVE